MTDELNWGLYTCVQHNEYGFEYNKNYKPIRYSEYLPNTDSLEYITIIIFEHEIMTPPRLWITEHEFDRIFKKVEEVRNNKIDLILNDTKTTN